MSSVSSRSPGPATEPPAALRLVRFADDDAATRGGAPFQDRAFVAAWMSTRGGLLGHEGWRLETQTGEAALALEIGRRGRLRVARFPGETHANANGWAIAAGAAPPCLQREAVVAAAAAAGVRIDALDLRRIADPTWLGPDFAITPAFEERFAISLAGGLEAVLERGNGKRKRKKFRAQQRHFAGKGGYRFLDLPRAARPAALAIFLAQKAERFRSLGMPDPFADKGIAAFLQTLFADPAVDTRLYVIESGGTPKAMLGGIVESAVFWGMFSSYAEDADAVASPGELLLWHMVERLAEEGLVALDLGPGTERYKQAWCDRIVPQVDAMLALTARGRVFVAAARLAGKARAAVKRHAGLRAAVQRLRRRLRPG